MRLDCEFPERVGRPSFDAATKWARIGLVVALCAAAIMLASCSVFGYRVATGSGRVVTKDMGFTNFDRVEVSSSFTVNIARSDSFKVAISIDDNLVDFLDVRQQGQTVSIGLKPGTYDNADLKADITMPTLRGVELSGASVGRVAGFESADNVDIELSGASQLNGELTTGDMRLQASGASKANLQGAASNLDLGASGASNVNLESLPVQDVKADISGASQVTINASGNLDADLSGASKLFYTGNPHLGRVSTSGAPEIRPK